MNPVTPAADAAADAAALARGLIDVHGPKAAAVARENARTAALAGQRPQAKFWIRVLGLIQQRATDKDERTEEPGSRSTASSTQG